ncbi:MAG: ATP-binding cassette domain-containing protein [Burkholderiales bacterium]
MKLAVDALHLVLPGGQRALAGVSLAVARGERVAVIGPSGAGKTSLLRLLGVALRPSSGSLAIDDVDPWALPARSLQQLRSRIGMIHQAAPLPPRQRLVTAVLAGRLGSWGLWRGLASLAYPADIAGARAALARLDLGERLFDRCDRLSGGQLQRVGVARVLYQKPELILADEPVSALDPQLADQAVGELQREAQSRGVTLVASLHAVDLALKWFPRIVGLREGAVVFDSPPVRISDAMLHDLYATESRTLPVQGGVPLERPEPLSRAQRRSAQPLCR